MSRTTARRITLAPSPPSEDELYPSSDGEPMAESGVHVLAIMLLFQALQDFFRDRPDVFLAADMFWYWEEGNPKARRAPDVMVVPGVGNEPRDSFLSWQENDTVPATIFEITSKGTWREDLHEKYQDYQRLGVAEYFIFDPIDRCLDPRLQGFRLQGKRYRRMRPSADGSLGSRFGFRVRTDRTNLRLIDATTGEMLLTRAEQVEQARLELEWVESQAELDRMDAEREHRRAEELAAEVERLRRLLGEQRGHGA
jgi:Uma2 family endonuclease